MMTIKPIATYFSMFLTEFEGIERFLEDNIIDDIKQLLANIDIKDLLDK